MRCYAILFALVAVLGTSRLGAAQPWHDEVFYGVELSQYRRRASLSHGPIESELRRIPGGWMPEAGSRTWLGVQLGAQRVMPRGLLLHFASLSVSGSLDGNRWYGATDGSVLQADRGAQVRFHIDGPGLGLRAKLRRFKFEAATYIGFTALLGDVMAEGLVVDENRPTPYALSLTWHASFNACRRVFPTDSACLTFNPFVYDMQWMSGGTIALRWETSL